MKKMFCFFPIFFFTFHIILFSQSDDINATDYTIASGNYHDPSIWNSGSVPTDEAWISTGTSVTATQNVLLNSGMIIEQNADFWMTNQSAMTLANFVNDGSFHPGDGTVNFTSSGPPYFSGMPTTFNNLNTVDGDVPVYTVVTVTNTLGLHGGSALLSENGSLYMGPGAAITATGGFDAYHCVVPRYGADTYGYLGRYAQSTSENLLFPVGTFVNDQRVYSPFEINFNSSSISDNAHFVVSPVAQKHPENSSSQDYINRYWEVYYQGFTGFSTAITATYDPGDVMGSESNLWGGQFDYPNTWNRLNQVDAANHKITGNVNGFSDFTAGEFDVMPVELTSFSALYDESAIILTWTTGTETNNYGFEIERVSSRQVGTTPRQREWKTIGFVEGNNTSTVNKEYKFLDNDVQNGIYYYRLRQIDLDGAASYSNVIEIEVGNAIRGFVLNQNYPNPFNPSTIISFGSSKKTKAQLIIYDQLGRKTETIFEGTIEANEIKKINFDASVYAGGVYFYKLITPEWSSTKKMVLLK